MWTCKKGCRRVESEGKTAVVVAACINGKRPPHQGQGEGHDFKILPVHYFLALFTTIPYLHENSVEIKEYY